MTRKEAEAEAKKLNKKDPDWFCPIIKDMCRQDCVNFVAAYAFNNNPESKGMIHDVNADDFEVNGHFCSCYQFIGPFFDMGCNCEG